MALSTRDAEAKPKTASLSWVRLEGTDTCIATQALATAVEARLGRKVWVSASEADVSVEGHVSRDANEWRSQLSVQDRSGKSLGTREITSDKEACSSFDDQLAFVVSLLIDPDAALSPAADHGQAPASPPPEPQIIVRRERVFVPVAALPPPERLELEGGLGVGVDIGFVPGLGTGVTGFVWVDPPRWPAFELGGNYGFGSSVGVSPSAHADVWLAYVSFAACPLALRRHGVSLRACAGMLAGSFRSQGVGFDATKVDDLLVLGGLVSMRVNVRLAGPLFVTSAFGFIVPAVRTRLEYSGPEGTPHEIFRGSMLAGAVEAGLAVHFP